MHIDDVVLWRNATDSQVALIEGYDWTGRFPRIVEAKNRQKQFVIDGEAVILVRWAHRKPAWALLHPSAAPHLILPRAAAALTDVLLLQRTQLVRGDLVLFDRVRLSKEATQVFHEPAGAAAGSCMGLLANPASIGPARPNPHSWFSTSKPTGNAGALSSSGLLHAGHGAPGAPQPQALGPCQGRSGCASQTHRQLSQRLQGCLIWLAIVLAIMVMMPSS